MERLYAELAARGIAFRPPVYLSDQWGCPDGTPLIGVPFYLADARLERIEAEHAGAIEGDDEAMRYLRHEAGTRSTTPSGCTNVPSSARYFGDYARPYRERYRADPFSRDYVRHILGWYAQKHPDEDFAETFAVWLTPELDWRTEYAGWGALRKLEYVDGVMREVGTLVADGAGAHRRTTCRSRRCTGPSPSTTRRRRAAADRDARQFDGDLRRIFARPADAPAGEPAAHFLRASRRRARVANRLLDGRGAPSVVRSLIARSRERAGDARAARGGTRGVDADRAHGVRHGGDDALAIHATCVRAPARRGQHR